MDINDFLAQDRFATASGIELTEAGEGYARAQMRITPRHLNGAGVCQGGALFTLADVTFAAACNSHGNLTVTIQSNINIFRGEKEGILYAEGREVFDRRRLSNCDVRITNEAGDLVATFTGMGYRKEARIK